MSDQYPDPAIPQIDPTPEGLAPPPAQVKARRPLTKTVLTAMAGIVAIAAVGFGIVSLTEGDGADSAEEAVQDMFDAVDRQDAIGVAEALEPTERRIVVDALEDAKTQANRVKVTDDGLDLHAVDGVDLSVEGLQLHATPLADDTYAVDIDAGRISSRAQLSKMPIGPVIQEVIDRNEEAGEQVDDVDEDEIELAGTRIVAVERGGQWYVSALFSLAEGIRLDGDPVARYPAAGSEIPAIGAASPEAAVREGIAAAVDADIRRLIELTPADEARVLHTYGPILVDEAKGEDTGVTVDDLELAVSDAPGGRKRVSATSMTMTVTTEWDRQVTTYDGKCSTSTWESTDPEEAGDAEEGMYGPNEWKQCDDDASTLSPFGFFNVVYAPASLDVIVEQHDGKWFLSPTGTVVEDTVGTLAGLDTDAVRRIARAWGGEWWLYEAPELWKACGVAQPSLDDSRADAEAAYDKCMDSLPDDYDGPWGPMGVTGPVGGIDSGDGSFDTAGSECYDAGGDEYSPDAIEACLADMVAAGELDPSVLASFQCGRIYDEVDAADDLPDDELDALLEKADAAYDECMAAADAPAGTGGGVSFGPGESTPTTASTTPNSAPTTTQPPRSTTATTRPPAVTTTTAP